MRAVLLVSLLLAGCSQDPPAKQEPAVARADAATKPHGLALITAASDFTQHVGGGAIVVVNADGALAIRAPIRGDGADVELASLKGDPIELTQVAARSAPPPPPAPPDANPMGVRPPEVKGQYYPPKHDDPCVHVAFESPPGLHARLTLFDRCASDPLLVVADAGADAARVIAVMSSVQLSQLAVTTDGGVHARPLRLGFLHGDGEVAPEPRELVFALRPDGVEAIATGGGTPWTWTGEAKDLSAAYREGRAIDGMRDARVRVRLDGKLTAGALITALVKLVEGGLDALVIGGG